MRRKFTQNKGMPNLSIPENTMILAFYYGICWRDWHTPCSPALFIIAVYPYKAPYIPNFSKNQQEKDNVLICQICRKC
jgi:hypothetical protein